MFHGTTTKLVTRFIIGAFAAIFHTRPSPRSHLYNQKIFIISHHDGSGVLITTTIQSIPVLSWAVVMTRSIIARITPQQAETWRDDRNKVVDGCRRTLWHRFRASAMKCKNWHTINTHVFNPVRFLCLAFLSSVNKISESTRACVFSPCTCRTMPIIDYFPRPCRAPDFFNFLTNTGFYTARKIYKILRSPAHVSNLLHVASPVAEFSDVAGIWSSRHIVDLTGGPSSPALACHRAKVGLLTGIRSTSDGSAWWTHHVSSLRA